MFSRLSRDLDHDPFDYRYTFIHPAMMENYVCPTHVHFHTMKLRRPTSLTSKNAVSGKGKNSFQVMLNAKHFLPEEIEVKTVDNFIVIHGKHEELADEHGFVSREFTRRYQVPDDVDPKTVISSLSKEGVLTVHAPRKRMEPPKNERVVPIIIQKPAAVEEAQKQQQSSDFGSVRTKVTVFNCFLNCSWTSTFTSYA
ncbi:protein lethal(2)essential for life [Caerostris darwini]|uniref:Protein lethal(2)essential for life n=1 Tax=Caerostris darwini TaxID=1538125 RepID=A0AAV4RQ94_9ARAC|nr:protein lethal(2)essential for life [Caerostris darwini]